MKHGQTKRKKLIDELKKELAELESNSREADLLRLTLAYLGVWKLPQFSSPIFPQSSTDAKIAALAANLERCMDHLEQIAGQGYAAAIEVYLNGVQKGVRKLNSLAEKHRDKILPLSHKCLSWPARISRRKVFGDDINDLIRKLEIGRDIR